MIASQEKLEGSWEVKASNIGFSLPSCTTLVEEAPLELRPMVIDFRDDALERK